MREDHSDLRTRRVNLDAPKADPNAALREIAGRIKKLSYRDMLRLAAVLQEEGKINATHEDLASALLGAADKLEKA
jgi:hypothetical protein